MAEVLNMDLVGVYNRVQRDIVEIQKSQSSNVSLTLEADLIRYKNYLSRHRALVDHISDKPDVDAPETNPMRFPLREETLLIDIENESCAKLALLLHLAARELVGSQSARLAAGLLSFDRKRILDFYLKMEKYIADVIEKTGPMDLPESSPRAPIQGAGLGGIDA